MDDLHDSDSSPVWAIFSDLMAALVGILVLAALVTPPDVITQIILFVVVYGLYEVSIQLVKRVEKQREERMRAEGTWFEDDEEEADADLVDELDEAEGKTP